MVLTAENYYSQEANEEYMSVSQFKDFYGTYGKMPCEFTAMEKLNGELFGTKWKIKMDSYIPDIAIVDLKVMASITKLEWVRDIGYLDFVRYWGYDIQGAIYQEIVRQNTGKKLPFYIAGATKESEPDIRIIHITDNYLAEALNLVEMNMARVLAVKTGNAEPDRCELCDCCRKTRVLKAPISITDLTAGI